MKAKLRIVLKRKVNLLFVPLFLFQSVSMSAEKNETMNLEKSEQATFQEKRTITGKVTDEKGELLPGVTIVEKGTTNGAITDINGEYSLVVSKDAKAIVFSFVGMESQEIELSVSNNINVVMKSSSIGIEEVVAIGYGTSKKKDLTGSVSMVKADEITSRKTTKVSESLQGAVAGVSISRNSSSPGESPTIRIRGITTMTASNDPLILVDDVPVGSIDDVNPSDIKNISFLKDAAAAAIYGSRAAAGVVIITTNRGKTEKMSISYDYNYFIKKPTRTPDVVDVTTFLNMTNEYEWNDLGNEEGENYKIYSENDVNNWVNNSLTDPDNYPNTNWQDLLMKDHSSGQRHSLSIHGGTENIKTIASFSHENQDGLYDHYNWERTIMRVNNDIKISKKIGAVIDLTYKFQKSSKPVIDPTYMSRSMPAIYPALWSDGRIAEGKQGVNPYATLNYGGFDDDENHLLYGRLGAWIRPIKGLKLSAYYSPSLYFSKGKKFMKSIPYWSAEDTEMQGERKYIVVSTDLEEQRNNNKKGTIQAFANYDKLIGSHKIEAMVGYEEFDFAEEKSKLDGKNFILNDYPYLYRAPKGNIYADDSKSSDVERAYRSVFSRLAYNYASKYFVQANLRADASSRFNQDYRWGYFPSFSVGWVVSEENFMEALDFLSFFKLRGSYGTLGNDRLNSSYLYLPKVVFEDILIHQGNTSVSDVSAAQRDLAIKDIRWEVTRTVDLGVDLSFINNKLTLTGDVYRKETEDMLLPLTVPALIGYGDPEYNVGSMTTNGWELAIGYNNKAGDFSYGVSFNLFDSKSKINDVAGHRIIKDNLISEQGSYFKEWYGYKTGGLFQTQEEVDNYPTANSNVAPGDVKYLDLSGPDGVPDGIINEEYDKVRLGSSRPHMEYGGNIKMGYKGISVSLAFQGVGKRTVALQRKMIEPLRDRYQNIPSIYAENYWSHYNTPSENLNARYPRLGYKTKDYNYAMSDFWLMNGAYFRLKNINVSYDLPKSLLNKLGIGLNDLSIYFSGNDLFSFDKYPDGWDPEVGGENYAITKTYLFGLSVKF